MDTDSSESDYQQFKRWQERKEIEDRKRYPVKGTIRCSMYDYKMREYVNQKGSYIHTVESVGEQWC